MPFINKKDSIVDIYRKNKEPDVAIREKIFNNPAVRDLPRIAAMHGFKSTFVFGQKGLYFAYGLNKALLADTIVENRGMVYPKSTLRDWGYFRSASPIMSTGFTAFKLPDDPLEFHEKYLDCMSQMKYLEYFIDRFRVVGMDIPPFLVVETQGLQANLAMPVFSSRYAPEAMRNMSLESEKKFLRSIAVYELSVDPARFRPDGDYWYHMANMYGYLSGNNPQKDFQHPSVWMKNFRSMENGVLYERTVAKNCAKYIAKEFDRLHIPYILESTLTGDLKAGNQAILSAAGDSSFADAFSVLETIAFPGVCLGFFQYFMDEFIERVFTQEEKEAGDFMLLSSSRKQMGRGYDPANYLTFINRIALPQFREYASKNGIRWGHPTASWLKTGNNDSDVAIITEISSMPLVLRWIQNDYSVILARHLSCLERDAPGEARIPYRTNPDLVHTYRKPYGLKNGTMHYQMTDSRGKTAVVDVPAEVGWFGGLSDKNDKYYASKQMEKLDYDNLSK